MPDSTWFVYIVECADGSLYTGIAKDVENRVAVHNKGQGAKYTRARLPVRLVFHEQSGSQGDALRREYAIKQMSTSSKHKLIATADSP